MGKKRRSTHNDQVSGRKEDKIDPFFTSEILDKIENYEEEIRKNDTRNLAKVIIPVRKSTSKRIFVKKALKENKLSISLRMPEPPVKKNLNINLDLLPFSVASIMANSIIAEDEEIPSQVSLGIADINQQAISAGLTISPCLFELMSGPCDGKDILRPNPDNARCISRIIEHIYLKGEQADVYSLKFPAYFYKFVKQLKMYRGFSKFLEICVSVSVCLYINNVSLEKAKQVLVGYITCIENSFHKIIMDFTPGLIFLSPPGMGKTLFQLTHPFGYLDTDNLNSEAIDADPTIIDCLVQNGLTVVTNRWEYQKWNQFKIAIFPPNIQKTMERKGFIFSDSALAEEMAKRKIDHKRKMKNRSGSHQTRKHPDGRDWVKAYASVKASCDIYIESDTFQAGFEQFQLLCLNLSNKCQVKKAPNGEGQRPTTSAK